MLIENEIEKKKLLKEVDSKWIGKKRRGIREMSLSRDNIEIRQR